MDPAMPDNPSTDPQLNEACSQVGRFLYHFALLEETVNDLMGQVLSLSDEQAAMTGWAIQTRKKLDLLEAAIQDQDGKDAAWKKRARSALNQVHELSDERNIVAHSPFGSHESGGVIFRRVTISGPKKQPKALQRTPKRWTPKQLDAKCERMDRTRV